MTSLPTDFFTKGFCQFELKDTDSKKRMLDKIRSAQDSDFDASKYRWESKYQHSEDFRPSVFGYDKSFVDVLFDNDIPQKVYEASNYRKLHLSHVQMRRVFPANSYMDWHRDSYYRSGKSVGPIPPPVKLIYYPLFEREEPCLKVLPGSHIRFFEHEESDIKINQQFGEETITSSDDLITLFDVSIWHSAQNGTDPNGNIRVIYAYSNPDQYKSNWEGNPINKEINDYYESRLS
jgi:hypothetical protein